MGALSLAGSLLGGAKFWIIGLVVAVAISGTFGYYKGYSKATSVAEDKLVAAQMEMYAKGVEAQKNFSDHQFMLAQADYDSRYSALQRQKQRQIVVTKEITKLVPQIAACTYSPDAMKALNDVVTE